MRTVVALLLILALVGFAEAVTSSKVLIFDGAPVGKVSFSGQVHSGFTCETCHNPDLFPKKQKGNVRITMADISAGRQCGACHNGKKAFPTKGNCKRCHKK